MKNKITLLVLLAVAITTGIFATPIKVTVNNQVLTSFNTRFEGAKDVSWNKSDLYIKASFTMDQQALSAYFSESGELIGVSRNLLSNQLPINLNTELKKLAANGWITDLFEFADGQETTYFVTVENANQKTQLKSLGYNSWSVYKKIKKS